MNPDPVNLARIFTAFGWPTEPPVTVVSGVHTVDVMSAPPHATLVAVHIEALGMTREEALVAYQRRAVLESVRQRALYDSIVAPLRAAHLAAEAALVALAAEAPPAAP